MGHRPAPAGAAARSRSAATSTIGLDPRMLDELCRSTWDQVWELSPTHHTPVGNPEARQRAWTVERMLEPFARDAIAMAEEPTGLDLRCGEGRLAQKLLDWGAGRVVGCDDRGNRLRRAALLRDHFAIPPRALELRERSPQASGRFDVVVLTGAIDRLAAADGPLPAALEATRQVCAIECLGEQAGEIAAAALAAGFRAVERARPPLQASPSYLVEGRELLIAFAGIRA